MYTASIIALMMEAVHTSETSVNFTVTTRRYIQNTNFITDFLVFWLLIDWLVGRVVGYSISQLFDWLIG
jgi:hypothetical protein